MVDTIIIDGGESDESEALEEIAEAMEAETIETVADSAVEIAAIEAEAEVEIAAIQAEVDIARIEANVQEAEIFSESREPHEWQRNIEAQIAEITETQRLILSKLTPQELSPQRSLSELESDGGDHPAPVQEPEAAELPAEQPAKRTRLRWI